jgi:hypothetical protein
MSYTFILAVKVVRLTYNSLVVKKLIYFSTNKDLVELYSESPYASENLICN